VHLVELKEIEGHLVQPFFFVGTITKPPLIARAISALFPSAATTSSITGDIKRALSSALENQKEIIIKRQIEIFDSVYQIRENISGILQELPENPKATSPLRSMRAACRKFLNNDCHSSGNEIAVALGELRGTFGAHLAILAVQYGIDINSELSSILPQEDEERKR